MAEITPIALKASSLLKEETARLCSVQLLNGDKVRWRCRLWCRLHDLRRGRSLRWRCGRRNTKRSNSIGFTHRPWRPTHLNIWPHIISISHGLNRLEIHSRNICRRYRRRYFHSRNSVMAKVAPVTLLTVTSLEEVPASFCSVVVVAHPIHNLLRAGRIHPITRRTWVEIRRKLLVRGRGILSGSCGSRGSRWWFV